MVVTFTDATGKVWMTEGAGKGKILWSDLTVTANVVTVNKKGVLSLAHDPRKSDGKTGQVEISVPSHPELHASLTIPVRYDLSICVLLYTAPTVTDGINGMDGNGWHLGNHEARQDRAIRTTAQPGEMAAMARNGSDGGNGGNGGDGGNAPPQ